jgi:hypothetical protein
MSNPLMAALHTQENFGPLWKQSSLWPKGMSGNVLAKLQEVKNKAARLFRRAGQDKHLLDVSEQLSNQEAQMRNMNAQAQLNEQHLLDVSGELSNREAQLRNMTAQAQRDEQRLLAAQAESASKYKGWVPLAAAGLTGGVVLPTGLVGGALLGRYTAR